MTPAAPPEPPPPDPAPVRPLSPPVVALAALLDDERKSGNREWTVRWTGENGWVVKRVGPVVRRSVARPPIDLDAE